MAKAIAPIALSIRALLTVRTRNPGDRACWTSAGWQQEKALEPNFRRMHTLRFARLRSLDPNLSGHLDLPAR